MNQKRFLNFLRKRFWFVIAFYQLILAKRSYMRYTGWIESLKQGYPCGADRSEIPWMNYPTVTILKERLNKDLTLFEFGSGYSTLFYAKLVGVVISVEHDKSWLKLMEPKMPDNVSLIYKEDDIDGVYCRSINECDREFDVVVVDGKDRMNCVKQAIEKLSPVGALVLDDTGRKEYIEIVNYVKTKGFLDLGLEGLKPNSRRVQRTTIFYRPNNCLNI